jgi:excisionase family DNA binding protein
MTTANNQPELLTLSEAAALLNVERHFVGLLVRQGKLPSYKLGPKTIRIPRAMLLRWIEEQAMPKAPVYFPGDNDDDDE